LAQLVELAVLAVPVQELHRVELLLQLTPCWRRF
jgi:hypothetical protein